MGAPDKMTSKTLSERISAAKFKAAEVLCDPDSEAGERRKVLRLLGALLDQHYWDWGSMGYPNTPLAQEVDKALRELEE